MRNKELVVLLPAYNEEKDVRRLVSRWQQNTEAILTQYDLSLKIVVVNDGSQDKTQAICNELEKQYDNFKLINHVQNKGLGKAVETGFLYVIESCPYCEKVCLMDCDNTQSPHYILDLLKKASEYPEKSDVVIASRYQKGAKVHGLAKYRLLTSEGAKYVYCSILRVKNVKDYTCGYRLYSKEILQRAYKRFRQSLIEESGFTCMAEILYKLYCIGARFEEIPFELHYDAKKGTSKMKVLKTARDSVLLAIRLKKIKRERPINNEDHAQVSC